MERAKVSVKCLKWLEIGEITVADRKDVQRQELNEDKDRLHAIIDKESCVQHVCQMS